MSWIHEKGIEMLSISEIVEKDKFFLSSPSYDKRKKIVNNEFRRNEKYNTCLYGVIAITKEGFIKPCPLISELVDEDNNTDLDSIFQNNKIDKYWRFTKENLKKCSN